MSEEYAKCLKRERDREAKRRETEQGAFEAEMLSFDTLMDSFEDPSKAAIFSDNGTGAEAVVDHCDGVTPESRRARCIRNARNRLKRAYPHLVPVFDLVVKNGSNRKESIWALAKTK